MELRHIRYFVMAAEEGSISSAAARLNISQPAVSRQIKDLEDELGTPLFLRTSTGLALTESGELALEQAKLLLAQAGNLIKSVSKAGKKATLKIGYISTALPGFLANGLRKFNELNPNVCVQIFEMTPKNQEEFIVEGKIDIGFMGHVCPILESRFSVQSIQEVPMAIALPDNHRLSESKSLTLSQLADETFLRLNGTRFPGCPETMKRMFDQAGISPRLSIEADGLSELLGLVGSGGGIALVPSDLEQLPHPNVIFIEIKSPKVTLASSAVWRKENETEALLNFIDLLG